MASPMRYPSGEELYAILDELRQRTPDPAELWRLYLTGIGLNRDDGLSEEAAAAWYLRGGFVLVDPSYPLSLDHIRGASALVWMYGMPACRFAGVREVWAYLASMVEEERYFVTPAQRAAAAAFLRQLASRLLPQLGKGPYSEERARLWVPAMREYYEQELPKIRAIFQKSTPVADRALALHALYPDIPLDDFSEWIDPKPRRGQQAQTHHTAILMTRRVAAWTFGIESAESFRQLLFRFPKPPSPPQPAWLPGSPIHPWPLLPERVLRRSATRQWAIQRALGLGEHSLGEEVLTFNADGIALTSQWSTVLQALHFPAMFRVKPWGEGDV